MPSFWTPVALVSDLPVASAIPARTPLGELAVWRSASGRVAAFHDRCPHRGMRLSHGFVRGEMLSCIYHGWRYDGTGQCRKIPAHPDLEPPAAVRATAIRCVEAGALIWVAAADADGAPPEAGPGQPLRSLSVAAPIAAVSAALGVELLGPLALDGAAALTVALQDAGDRTMLHVLVDPSADNAARIAASRALEALRRDLEEKELAA